MTKYKAAITLRTNVMKINELISIGDIRLDAVGQPMDMDIKKIQLGVRADSDRKKVIYARTLIASTLGNQIELLLSRDSSMKIYSDIGCGRTISLRDGMRSLIQDVSNYRVKEIHVTTWDRLTCERWFKDWLKEYECRVITARAFHYEERKSKLLIEERGNKR